MMVAMYQSYFRSNLDFNFLLIGSIFIISFFYFVFFFSGSHYSSKRISVSLQKGSSVPFYWL